MVKRLSEQLKRWSRRRRMTPMERLVDNIQEGMAGWSAALERLRKQNR